MNEPTCIYCGEAICGCGARSRGRASQVEPPHQQRREPFPYNGYIVWPLVDEMMDTFEFQFWRGDTCAEVIAINRGMLRDLCGDGIATSDPMPFIWQLFEVAQGNKGMVVIQEKNARRPAMFAITRLEQDVPRLTWDDVVEQYKMQGGDLLR